MGIAPRSAAVVVTTATGGGLFHGDPPRVDVSLRVDIASAADLPRRHETRLRAALVLLSHAGYSQHWRDERDGKDVFDRHGFAPTFYY